jgi:MFS family permease
MRSTLFSISSLLLGLFFLIVGHGLQMTLLPLRAEAEGWPEFEIGLIGSAYYIGFVAGCFGAPYLIRHAAHIRAFSAMVSLVVSATVLLPLWVAFGPWFVLRIVIGACLAGLYMVLESWLNESATNQTRGGIMAAYVMVNYGAIAVGQLGVTLHTPEGFALFAVGAIAMSLSAIPVALTSFAQPAPVAIVRFRPLQLFKLSPVGVVGVAMVGLSNGAFWSLGAVSAVGAGLSAQQAAMFMAIVTACGAVAQWPAGRLSDRIDRRFVLIGLLIAAAVTGLLFLLPVPPAAWFGLAILFGFAMSPAYSISAAHAYDHAAPGTFVETAAGLFVVNATAAIIGPLVASAMMASIDSSALFLFTAIVHAALAGYVLLRVRRRPAPVAPDKTDFDIAATAPVAGGMPVDVVVPEEDAAQDFGRHASVIDIEPGDGGGASR